MSRWKALEVGLLLVGGFWSLSSCKVDCRRKPYKNGGTCIEGSCECPFPWEGNRCETHAHTKFLGTWQGSSNCVSDNFKMKIEAEDTRLKLIDEHKHQKDLEAILTSSTEFVIPAQRYGTLVGPLTISGNGRYRNGLIYIDLKYDYNANF